MDVQAAIPAALCAIHNFIQQVDPEMFFTPEFQVHHLECTQEDDGDVAAAGALAEGPVDAAEQRRADERRDHIAEVMWQDYCCEARARGIHV